MDLALGDLGLAGLLQSPPAPSHLSSLRNLLCAYADLPPKRLAAFAPYLSMVNSRLFRLPSTEGWRGQLLGSYDFGRTLGTGRTQLKREEIWPQWLFGRLETLF